VNNLKTVSTWVTRVSVVRAEKAAVNPVLPPSIWNGVFSLSVTTAFATFFGQGVAFVALPFLFQSAYGVSRLRSALLFTPWPAVIVIIGAIAGRLADRVRPSILAPVGLVIFTAGLICLVTLGDHPSLVRVLAYTALAGAGFGLFQFPTPAVGAAVTTLSVYDSGVVWWGRSPRGTGGGRALSSTRVAVWRSCPTRRPARPRPGR